MKQLIKNYTFTTSSPSAGEATVTLTDFGTVRLDRLQLIVDTTINKLLYNFADSTVSSATVSGNIVTLSTVSNSVTSSDKLQIIYDSLSTDPVYDAAGAVAQDASLQTLIAAVEAQATSVFTKSTANQQGTVLTINTTSTSVLASYASRLTAGLQNVGTSIPIWVSMAASGAVVGSGWELIPGAGLWLPPGYLGPVCAIAPSTATNALTVIEF
jgi:hypothetical protein